MNRKFVTGTLAGLAALALAVVGGTYSAPNGAADIGGNTVRGGVLVLTLGTDGAGTNLAFHDLMPGATSRQLIWVAGNDRTSSSPGDLALTFRNLRDRAAPCGTSLDKAEAEIASGIGGCTVTDGVPAGTPRQGNLSRLLAFDVTYAAGSAACSAPVTNSALPAAGPGNLRASATPAGTTVRLTTPGGTDHLVLQPGEGVCVVVTAYWPPDATTVSAASPEHPIDNAAQDDSFTVDVRFDLTQVPG